MDALLLEDIELAVPEFPMDPQLMDVLDLMEAVPPEYGWKHQVIDILEGLSAKDKALLEARFYERLSYREMARRFGWNHPESARWATHKALSRFKSKFEEVNEI